VARAVLLDRVAHMIRHSFALCLSLIFTASTAMAAGPEGRSVSVGSEVTAASRYIWRGLEEGGFSVQPNTWIAFDGIRAATWFNFAAVPTERPTVTERHVAVQYGRAIGSYEVTAGWKGYFFPSGNRQSHEAYASIKRPGRLTPSAAIYHDFQLGSGTYLQGAITHRLPALVPAIDLLPSFSLGYNHEHWVEGSGLSDANFGLKATWSHRHLALSPFINHSRSLNQSILPTRTYGGIEVALR
jgi:hypothetical protein